MQNNSAPLVSVVIACYNHDQFVQDSIQGVIDQSYQNIELIIIDDGSSDGSVTKIEEMIEKCQERFTRFEFRHRPNKGLSATLNEALEWCQGKYYNAVASDDILLVEKIKLQVDFLEKNKKFVAVFGGVLLIDENNRKLEEIKNKARSYSFQDIIMHRHNLLAPTQMIRKDAIEKVGGYNPNLFIEDWYMWLKLSKEGKIFNMDILLALYRKHDNNISKNHNKMQEERLKVLNEFKGYKYYNEAIKKTEWINAVERFVTDSQLKNYMQCFNISPLRTIRITYSSVKKRIENAKKTVL